MWVLGIVYFVLLASPNVLATVPREGIRFECPRDKIRQLDSEMQFYLTQELGLSRKLYTVTPNGDGTELSFVLATPKTDTNSLNLSKRPEFDLTPEIANYRRYDGKVILKEIVSKAEIAAALMQHGDQYVLSGERCSVDALKEHIAVRQNIAKWGTIALQRWYFPEEWIEGKDGKTELISKYAVMNPKTWEESSSKVAPGVSVYEAVADAFVGSFPYEVGCLTAAKLIFVMGILDYYKNVAKDHAHFSALEERANRAPLSEIDSIHEKERPYSLIARGKYLIRRFDIPADRWIPGDWGYLRNTDDASSDRPGYEGSNVSYLGQTYFNNYFGDRPNAKHGSHLFYPASGSTFLEDHLLEVFHWRFGIMENWKNDPRRKFLTEEEVANLLKDPRAGGLTRDVRDSWGDY